MGVGALYCHLTRKWGQLQTTLQPLPTLQTMDPASSDLLLHLPTGPSLTMALVVVVGVEVTRVEMGVGVMRVEMEVGVGVIEEILFPLRLLGVTSLKLKYNPVPT